MCIVFQMPLNSGASAHVVDAVTSLLLTVPSLQIQAILSRCTTFK